MIRVDPKDRRNWRDMGTDTMTHGGYTVTAEPRPVEGEETWSAVMTISRGSEEDRESWILSAGDRYGTREEAVERCFTFAREVIDREMEGCALE
jgi:hypothetical protein